MRTLSGILDYNYGFFEVTVRFPTNHLLPFLLIALLCSGVYALRFEIETYVSSMWAGELCMHLHDACEGNVLFNRMLALSIICCAFFTSLAIYTTFIAFFLIINIFIPSTGYLYENFILYSCNVRWGC